ncbi:helix-turn-helix domain-containing protein [Bradyrhizobium diazoefficiens]|uniref:helix-turn-helix domain-containing protein n=1 Tax=Bradyrhizobium diazoefficiens TaxID=1355477 RepID=UPI000D72CEE9|nr:helix-turn-helix domain-containing protein [Bradyrhizobium diazoefficiens]AWO87541.1 helix-turn-helix domain-containing protein [Bradyrhizobium diazoefficiens]
MNPYVDDHLRETLRQGFGNRPTVGFAEAAKLLNLDTKSLRRLIQSGRVPFRTIGCGRRRLRREFTVSDLESFYAGAATRTAHATGVRRAESVRVRPRDVGGGSFVASFETETKQEKK